MSDDQTDYRAAELAEKKFEYTPMPDPMAPASEEKIYSSETHGIREAAQDLSERRELGAAPTQRAYVNLDGPQKGEKRPIWEQVSLDRAARDLHNARAAEDAAFENAVTDGLAEQVDRFRISEAAAEQAQQAPVEQPEQLEPQPTEAAPETAPANSLAEKFRRLDPELRQAVEQQAMAAHQARGQYEQAAQLLMQATESQLLTTFPELKGATRETLPHILHGINSRDPQRAQSIVQHIQSAQQNILIAQQHQAAEAQRQHAEAAQQFHAFAKAADAEYDNFERSRRAAEVKMVRENVMNVLKDDFGIDAAALQQLYNSHPQFRSAQAQKLIYQAVRASMAEKAVRQSSFKGLPRVPMRPGMADTGSVDYHGVGEKMREFSRAPSAKSAAAALMARRRAAAADR